MKVSILAAVLAAPLMFFQPVLAHTDAGPYHLELIAKNGALVLHVTDHAWKEIHTEGGEGKATIQQGKSGSKITVKLEPSQQNMLTGNGEFQVTPETVIVVFVKLPEQDAYGARFTPLKPKTVGTGKKGGEGHRHDHDLQHQHH
jgi:hypothetical protein